MDQLLINQGPPLLSILIFLPIAGAFFMLLVNNEDFARYWTLAVTSLTAVLSLPVLFGFDRSTTILRLLRFAISHRALPPSGNSNDTPNTWR